MADRLAVLSVLIFLTYCVLALLSATGIIANEWSREIGPSYAAPGGDFIFGTDIFGRSVFDKVIKGTEVAMSVGLVSAVISGIIGVSLGAVAGYFGGKIDEFIVWFYTTFSSIPYIMLLVAIAFILGKGLTTVYLALGLTSWVSLCRLIRGEVIRHKDREYVQAAAAIGGSDSRRLFKHILPNVSHIMIVNFSLQFQTAIKSEVILSYLGLGVQGRPSWGTMIDDAKLELARGVWWQLGAATLFMFIIVLSLNIVGDALRDALDPKLKGK
jgi:peptide/nickel transport system permease protein